MSEYTPTFTKPYPDGWKDKPDETTPVTAEIMDAYDEVIENIENYLSENTISENGGENNGDIDLADLVVQNSISMGRKEDAEIGFHSTALGAGVTASANCAHSEGQLTTSSGICAHSEGYSTKATAQYAHSEGVNTVASASSAHSEGNSSIADGQAAHAEGLFTLAKSNYQHVEGKFNVEDTENKYAHIVGGGTSPTDRKNIHTLDWEGNAEYAGTVKSAGLKLTDTITGQEYIVTVSNGNLEITAVY